MSESQPEKQTSRHAPAPDRKEEIRKRIKELLSDDYTVRAASINELGKYGEAAAEALVDTLIKKSDNPHLLANFSDALAEIGKPSLNIILHALDHVAEVRRSTDVYLLESLIDLLGLMHDRRVAAPLLLQIDKLNRAMKGNPNAQLVECCEAAKVRIHGILKDLGEKGGTDDLLNTLGDGRSRVRQGVVDALIRVGDRRALVPLVRLHDIEEHVSYSGAQDIKEAIREISRRERITPDDALYTSLQPEERSSLERVYPKARNGNGNGKH